MGTLCIAGVDDNVVLKDFVRAHVERLSGHKVCIGHWYPDYIHEGRTIRAYYRSRPWLSKLYSLLPHAAYRRWIAPKEKAESRIHDALTTFFRKHNVDVVLAEFGTTGAALTPHLRKLGIPLVVHFHGNDAHKPALIEPRLEQYKDMFQHAFRIISVSRFMTDALVSIGADPDKVITNHYGPREHFYENVPDYRSKTVLALGRFTDIKANHLTILAFNKVLDKCPDARLVMVGTGELFEACNTLVRTLGIEANVSMLGAVAHANIAPLFQQACCFVQHSVTPSYGDAEGTPVVILEAGAAALPVVATRHAGIPDVVTHGETGFLVEERDIEGMAANLLRLIEDPVLCRTMGAAARARVQTHFSLDRHIAVLQSAIDMARGHGK